MADPETQGTESEGGSSSTKKQGRWKTFISPTSSFVDFTQLESEYYTQEGRSAAHLYHPYQDRKIKKPITNIDTTIHVLKGSIGAGILAMPKAFYNSGLGIGIVGTVLLGILCVYGIHTLLKTQYIQCQRLRVPFLTLPRSMKVAMLNGPSPLKKIACIAPFTVDFFLISLQLGCCTVYAIFIAKSIKDLVEPRLVEEMDQRFYILMITVPLVLINFVRNLKTLTPVSLIANILVFVAFSGIFYYIFFEGTWKTEDTRWVAPIQTWPLFMGTVLFAIEAVGVIIALEHNMKNPENFLGVKGIFPWSMIFVVSVYFWVGLLSYLKYANDVKETIVVTIPTDEWLSMTVEGLYALSIFGSYPLQCFVSLEIIWGNYLSHHVKDPQKECIVEYALRIIVVIFTVVMAVAIPHVDLMISLVGSFSLSMLGITFPFLMELCTLWPDQYGCCCYVFIKDIFFILLGFFILFIGTYEALYAYIIA